MFLFLFRFLSFYFFFQKGDGAPDRLLGGSLVGFLRTGLATVHADSSAAAHFKDIICFICENEKATRFVSMIPDWEVRIEDIHSCKILTFSLFSRNSLVLLLKKELETRNLRLMLNC